MKLLDRASLWDVVRGKAALVGSRLDPEQKRGFVSPVEARMHLGLGYGDMSEGEKDYLDGERSKAEDAKLVLRALLSRTVAPSTSAAPVSRATIVSATVDNVSIEGALGAITAPPPENRARMVHFVHPHALNLASFDPTYAALLSRADLVLPDGVGLRIAAKILGVALEHNVNGTDLLPPLCDRAAANGIPLVLVGGAPGIADACAEALIATHPGLRIAHTSHGYLDDDATEALVSTIRGHAPCIVLIGMGSPIQERWSWTHLDSIPRITVLTVGGLFDFFSGRIPRAPMVWRELGMEWAWRLKQEPRRLAKRYLLGNPLFLALALKQRITGTRSPRRTP